MRLLLSVAVLCLSASTATADDAYLLKIEEAGYDREVSENETPNSETARSVELLVRPGEPFTLRLETGGAGIALSGLLHVSGGVYRLQWSDDPSRKIGGSEAINTGVSLELGQPKVIKSMSGEVAKDGGLWQKFRRETKVTLRSAVDRPRNFLGLHASSARACKSQDNSRASLSGRIPRSIR
jgi:hypothetical protein